MAERASARAVVGTVVFAVVVPGTAIGLVPWLLTGWQLAPPFLGNAASRALGIGLILVAAPIFLDFLARFALEGRGTPAPIAPTERLVVGGPFRYVRNPGYVCVVAIVVGQALLFGSAALLAYAALLAAGFHLFVLLYEEPTLRRSFGAEYEDYCRRVPRWIPRLRPRA
jgi:protein-S-isoprenylcysteine O-methyltransferase Ste14